MGAAILPSLLMDRPGTAFGIPCFHAEFPVFRGAESSKEHSLPGNPWNSRGKCTKQHAQCCRSIGFLWIQFVSCSRLQLNPFSSLERPMEQALYLDTMMLKSCFVSKGENQNVTIGVLISEGVGVPLPDRAAGRATELQVTLRGMSSRDRQMVCRRPVRR